MVIVSGIVADLDKEIVEERLTRLRRRTGRAMKSISDVHRFIGS
jgi:hypothetical protein